MPRTFKKIIILVMYLIISFSSSSFAQDKINGKKIIEFGWDYPTITYLRNNAAKMQKTPFDGVCFSLDFDIYNAFDTALYPDSKFQYNDLSAIQWGKFTDNFLLIRAASYSGAHWLDDKKWQVISKNLTEISKALSIGKAKGIALDPEYYFKDSTLNPWVYKPSYYNNLSYQQVGDFVRKRGKLFIEALQTYSPDVKILCFWLLGLVYAQNQTYQIQQTGMALYPFFAEGMLEGKNNSSEIIDGNESSYWYQQPANFLEAGSYIREKENQLLRRSSQAAYENISIAKAVYLDGLYAKAPQFDKGFDKQTRERWLWNNLCLAYKTTDKYVWFYNENTNWWKDQVDSGVAEIITEVKNKVHSEYNNNASQINGRSFIMDFQKKKPVDYQGFSYNYLQKNNTLEIKLLQDDILNIKVYENSRLIYNLNKPSANFTINLQPIYKQKGNLILISSDVKGIRSVAFVN
jgi:hypothetical protein